MIAAVEGYTRFFLGLLLGSVLVAAAVGWLARDYARFRRKRLAWR